jgi:AcrR family transcriptional regulator
VSDEHGGRPIGLRERKKAATRAAIQRHALRLFDQQGYDATTIDQIAAAAEVSPATVFRYYATKEDLVLSDDYDPLIAAAYERQPAELSPVAALRAAMREALAEVPTDELDAVPRRTALIMSVPQLRASALDNVAQTIQMLAELVGRRVGRPPEDLAVRTLAGAMLGVMVAVMFHWAEHPEQDARAALDDAMAQLEAGLPL